MSNSDSFIEEVTEEVRRDKLFAFIRRWGWVAILVVLLLVGGAAWFEYTKARDQAEAQAFGDAILAALQAESPEARRAALAEIEAEDTRAALLTMLSAGEAGTDEARDGAAETLEKLSSDKAIPAIYRELATLKAVMLRGDTLEPEARIERLTPLTIPGAAFRNLAQEQIALAHVAAGDGEQAIDTLTELLDQDGVSQAQRRRASQMIVALGGSLDAA